MERLHPPLGRYFDPTVEAFADKLALQPVWHAQDLGLDSGPSRGRQTVATMPDGLAVEGFLIRRPDWAGVKEVIMSCIARDLGAPSVPYAWLPLSNAVFSPVPFSKALPGYDNFDLPIYSITHPVALGAIEPFMRMVNKADDHVNNRLHARGDGKVAIIDNELACPRSDQPINYQLATNLEQAAASCHKGARLRAYTAAKAIMTERIINYPASRFIEIADVVSASYADVTGRPLSTELVFPTISMIRNNIAVLAGSERPAVPGALVTNTAPSAFA